MKSLDEWAQEAFGEAEYLAKKLLDAPKCIKCGRSVQLIRQYNAARNEWGAIWKCRTCKHAWEVD